MISIIIPNYNGKVLLEKNLPFVVNAAKNYSDSQGEKVEIIIVDDASTDNSIDFINTVNTSYKNISFHLLINKKNQGFSSTINKGVSSAQGEYMLLLNTDVCPDAQFLKPLVDHLKEENVFGVAAMDRSIEKGKEVLRGRGIGRWKKGFLIHSRGEIDKNNTLWISGGSGVFNKDIWRKLGGFSSLYNPFYWEDIDVSYRALKTGYKLVFEKKSVVIHEHLKGSIASQYNHFKVTAIAYRNQFIFVWVNITDPEKITQHVLWLPYHFVKSILNKDWAFMVGFLSALAKIFQALKQRAKNKKLFVKTDTEVIKEFFV